MENIYKRDEKGGGYGKRPLWQWVVLYLIIGGALYYLVYAFYFRGRYSANSYTGASSSIQNNY